MNNRRPPRRVPAWERVEARLQAFVSDRARMALFLQLAYYVSTAVVVLGAVLAMLFYAGVWRP